MSRRLNILYFSSPTCGPCKVMLPRVQLIVDSLQDIDLKVIDVTKDMFSASLYDVKATPTLVFLNDQERPVDNFVGAAPDAVLLKVIQRNQQRVQG